MNEFQVSISRRALLDALRVAAGAGPTAADARVHPVLKMAMILGKGSSVVIETTDMKVSAQVTADCDPGACGVALAPIAGLTKALGAMTGDKVFLSQNEPIGKDAGRISVACGAATLNLESDFVVDFPALRSGELRDAITFDISSHRFSDTLKRVAPAVSTEKTRHYLNGQYWHISHDGVRAVASDGHRLFMVELNDGDISDLSYPMPKRGQPAPGSIIPRETTHYLAKILPTRNKAVPVRVEIGQMTARFSFGPVVIVTKTIYGTFPEYERVIPRDNAAEMRVSRKVLLGAMAMVGCTPKEKWRGVVLARNEYGNLHVAMKGLEGGIATNDCEADFSGDVMPELGFNPRYLRDALGLFYGACEDIVFRFSDAVGPATIHSPSRPGDVAVLPPMRF